ncbi:ATP-binding protein [Blastococcus xanthinilyticus]|uniref:ATP-binding protein n=1 Tax=Blastococcus xanthinilyticus TaxID=1564164 RepID=UPI001FB844F0|nr:ATP-binding protein [Blastococcus xanthinilyticus]
MGRWQPGTLAELTLARRQLNAALHDGARPAGCDEGAVQLLLLAFEELVSNALRHGGTPIEVVVTRTGACWLLEVRDTAADRPPAPARDRDPALGGLGLPLVAKICDDHGWTVEDGRKLVWASLAHSSAGPPDAGTPGCG